MDTSAITSSIERSANAPSARTNQGILVFSHLRWNFVWQRPQQFLSRFAKDRPVLFIEEPEFHLEDGADPVLSLENAAFNVTVATPHLPVYARGSDLVEGYLRCLTREALEVVNADGAFDRPLLWYYSPMDSSWSLDEFACSGIVYDCMDELSQFKGAPPELIENERKLMERADVVFTGGYELWLKKAQLHDNVHFFGCGVEYDHFSKAQDDMTPIPADVRDLQRPIVGWFGVVDERMDYELLSEAARLRPRISFVVVGPVVKVDPAALPQAENIHWLGGREYRVLPNYCRAFDVCMMPFALNEATEYINPTKALEYLATGRPVVSTPVADVVRQYADTICIARTAEDFVKCIDRALSNPDVRMLERGIEMARDAGWDSTVLKMNALIDEALGLNTPPNAFLF